MNGKMQNIQGTHVCQAIKNKANMGRIVQKSATA